MSNGPSSKASAIKTVELLLAELRTGTNSNWENETLRGYLDGMLGWLLNCEGYYARRGENFPVDPWAFLEDAIQAARVY